MDNIVNKYWIKYTKNYIEDCIVNHNELTDDAKKSLVTLYENITLDNAQSTCDTTLEIIRKDTIIHTKEKNVEIDNINKDIITFLFAGTIAGILYSVCFLLLLLLERGMVRFNLVH
jgi:hypothetical protein